jgi:predicted metalloendopeptidase
MGKKTLGENIADNGGLREAYYAYKYYVSIHGAEQKLGGFESYTHDQLFFMAYGNVWCETLTNAALKFSLEDSHCPGRIRLMGTLSNSKEFQDAFKCKPGSKMYKKHEERCIIW